MGYDAGEIARLQNTVKLAIGATTISLAGRMMVELNAKNHNLVAFRFADSNQNAVIGALKTSSAILSICNPEIRGELLEVADDIAALVWQLPTGKFPKQVYFDYDSSVLLRELAELATKCRGERRTKAITKSRCL